MADLREVRRKFERARKEQEEAAAELRRAKVEPKLGLMTKVWIKDDKFCEKLESLANEEVKILATKISDSLDEIFANAEEEIEEARAKRKEKLEQQKQRRAQKNDEVKVRRSDSSSDVLIPDELPEGVETVIDPDLGLEVPRHGMYNATHPETGEKVIFMNGRLVR